MLFPSIRLLLVPLPEIQTPSYWLAEMTLRASERGSADDVVRCAVEDVDAIDHELGYWLQRDTEEGKRLVLDRRRSGQHGEWIVRCDRGDDSIAHQGREIGQQRVEAVHRQPVRGQAGGLLGDSGR